MNDQRNLFIAIGLSLVVLLGFQFFFELPRLQREQAEMKAEQLRQEAQAPLRPEGGTAAPGGPPASSAGPSAPGAPAEAREAADLAAALAAVPRIAIETPRLTGSIALTGGRIDDLILKGYRETIRPDSAEIRLLRPGGGSRPYFVEFGWVAEAAGTKLPTRETVWRAQGTVLAPDRPVVLHWDNGAGLRFERHYAIDRDYLVTVRQRVTNTGTGAAVLFPYGFISRTGTPDILDFYILHEGPLGVLDGTLREIDYSDMRDAEQGRMQFDATGGWIGITDKYWLTALIPDQRDPLTYRFLHQTRDGDDRYQVDYLGSGRSLGAGATAEVTSRLFLGAKEVKLLDRYEEEHGVEKFDLAIDFGWFYFLTKPFFYALSWMNDLLGNFGLAILAFTILVKLVFFPLANKSYRSMAKLRELTPRMQEMRERFGDDRQRLNQEMMKLYREEKVNPASGCLPIAVQIPVFFSLYKVLFVSIEMRQAPFYGWITDLSVADPTSIFNAFGLIPWNPPDFLSIGAWPLIMGLTMWLQQRLNPQPTDPLQAKIFMFLPIFFTFLLAQFPAGLVIYWAWNNVLSIGQQKLIMHRMGVK